MSSPAEKAAAYLTRLEADRRAALAVSEAKAEEAKLIKARQEGFEKALEILGLQISPDNAEPEPAKSPVRQRRNIPKLIMRELSFSGTAMAKEQISRSIDYLPSQTERALRRLESSGKIVQNMDGRWEVVTSTVAQIKPTGTPSQPPIEISISGGRAKQRPWRSLLSIRALVTDFHSAILRCGKDPSKCSPPHNNTPSINSPRVCSRSAMTP
jgi:hypothetical protein